MDNATADGPQDGINLIGKQDVTKGHATLFKIMIGALAKTNGLRLATGHFA